MKQLVCPVCDAPMAVKAASNGKVFAQCKTDALQILIRTNDGCDRFSARYGTAWKGGAPAPEPKPAPATEKKPAPAAEKKPPAPAPEPAKKKGGFFV